MAFGFVCNWRFGVSFLFRIISLDFCIFCVTIYFIYLSVTVSFAYFFVVVCLFTFVLFTWNAYFYLRQINLAELTIISLLHFVLLSCLNINNIEVFFLLTEILNSIGSSLVVLTQHNSINSSSLFLRSKIILHLSMINVVAVMTARERERKREHMIYSFITQSILYNERIIRTKFWVQNTTKHTKK